jgi:hypothetical protein
MTSNLSTTTRGSDDTDKADEEIQFCCPTFMKGLAQNFRNTKDSVVFVYGHARTGLSTGQLFMDTETGS